jgi:DNA-binding transcriptional LysR family regulator
MRTPDIQPLRLLCAIVETKSVSRASESLGISQPTASYLLGKLREQLGDPLFLKSKTGMTPTPRTLSVYEQTRRGLDALDAAFSPTNFDPASSDRMFRLAMSDIGEMVFLPPVIRELNAIAPAVSIEISQIPLAQLPRALDLGDVDFGIGNLPEICSQTAHTTAFKEHYVCVGRRDHPLGKSMTRKAFEQARHVIVTSPFTGHHVVERALLEKGVRRTAILKIANYTSVPNVLAETDLLVTLPSRVAKVFERHFELQWSRLPLSVPTFDVRIHWSQRHESNDGHRWMRQLLVKILRQL